MGMNKFQALARGEVLLVAVAGDRHALYQLHHEVRPTRLGRAGVEHLGDVRMLHQRQRVLLRREASDHLPAVHPGFDEFQRDHAPDRVRLLGHVHGAHASFADLLEELVRADRRAGLFVSCRFKHDRSAGDGRRFQKAADLHVRAEQSLDSTAQSPHRPRTRLRGIGRVPGANPAPAQRRRSTRQEIRSCP
jgi:hypothetical protein